MQFECITAYNLLVQLLAKVSKYVCLPSTLKMIASVYVPLCLLKWPFPFPAFCIIWARMKVRLSKHCDRVWCSRLFKTVSLRSSSDEYCTKCPYMCTGNLLYSAVFVNHITNYVMMSLWKIFKVELNFCSVTLTALQNIRICVILENVQVSGGYPL